MPTTPTALTVGQRAAFDTGTSQRELLLQLKALLTHPQVIQHLAYPLVVGRDVCGEILVEAGLDGALPGKGRPVVLPRCGREGQRSSAPTHRFISVPSFTRSRSDLLTLQPRERLGLGEERGLSRTPHDKPPQPSLLAPQLSEIEVSQSKTAFPPKKALTESQGWPPAAHLGAPFLPSPQGQPGCGPWEDGYGPGARGRRTPPLDRPNPPLPAAALPNGAAQASLGAWWSRSYSRLMLAALLCSSLSFFSSSAAFLSSSACC